jgi:hypothetical protein
LRQAASPNVEFLGFVSDEELFSLYARASVYVQASMHEGFGLSVAEAMSAGCIPVVTRAGSLPEVVGDVGGFGGLFAAKGTCNAAGSKVLYELQRVGLPVFDGRGQSPGGHHVLVEGFPACVAHGAVFSAARVGGLLGPLENRQFFVAAMDDNPPHRTLSLLAANLTSIDCANHSNPR